MTGDSSLTPSQPTGAGQENERQRATNRGFAIGRGTRTSGFLDYFDFLKKLTNNFTEPGKPG